MTSQAKLEANRQNATRSTGPTSAKGKAQASKNATKHGLLATNPVVLPIENRDDWLAHRAAVFESLSPVGQVETLLAGRTALLFWRLARVGRYEQQTLTIGLENLETDLGKTSLAFVGSPTLAEIVDQRREAKFVAETLAQLPHLHDEDRLDHDAALAVVWQAYDVAVEGDGPKITIPGVPDDDNGFVAFDGWTAGLLRGALQKYGEAARTDPEILRKSLLDEACETYRRSNEAIPVRKRELSRVRSERLIPSRETLERITRYESMLERSLFRTLHELERIQATRLGRPNLGPITVDVDVSGVVDPAGSAEATAQRSLSG